MAIGFSNIPADLRVPLFYAEMDNSAANSASSTLRGLIVAQVNDNATSTEVGSLVLVSSVALAKSIGGQGSMLASMYDTWRKTDPVGEIWCLPLQNTVGSIAKADLKLTGAAPKAACSTCMSVVYGSRPPWSTGRPPPRRPPPWRCKSTPRPICRSAPWPSTAP